MINTYRNARGQIVAQATTGAWHVYDPATGTLGATAAAPTAAALRRPVVMARPAPPAKTRTWPMWAGAAVAAIVLITAIVVTRQPTIDMTVVQAENNRIMAEAQKSAKAENDRMIAAIKDVAKTPAATDQPAAPAKAQAIQVEVIPLSAKKEDTHAHVLHAQECRGNEGKRVKVRVSHPTVPGLKGWDWYTCPPKKT